MIRLFQKSLTSRLTSRVCQAAFSSHMKRHHSSSQEENVITITKVYNDEEGQSHFGSMEIKLKGSGDIGYLSKLIPTAGIIFRQTPSTYNYEWHNAPARQFIVNLDAAVEVLVSDGEKRVLEQGEVFFVEDLHGKGHFSKAVNNKFRSSLFIPVTDEFIS